MVDQTFQSSISGSTAGVLDTVVQPDGKIIAVGSFHRSNGAVASRITRLNPDGSLDPTFNTGTGANAHVRTVVLQPDGKILICGSFSAFNGFVAYGIIRLNANGNVDGTFNQTAALASSVSDILLLPSGKLLVGGFFSISGTGLVRLSANGAFETGVGNFNSIVHTLAAAPDGKILVGGEFTSPGRGVVRLNADLSLDNSFYAPGFDAAYKVAVQLDGKVIVGAYYNGMPAKVVRLNPNGTADTVFSFPFDSQIAFPVVYSLTIQVDGRIIAAVIDDQTARYGKVIRFNTDATVDPTFQATAGSRFPVTSLQLLEDGKILTGGFFTAVNGQDFFRLVKLSNDGSVDGTFKPVIDSIGIVYATKYQNDGKVLIAGDFEFVNGIRKQGVARLLSDGSLDTSFSAYSDFVEIPKVIEVQADGKILVGGQFLLTRMLANGGLDQTFNVNQGDLIYSVAAIAIQPDSKIIIGGQIYNSSFSRTVAAMRLNSNGSTDSSFTLSNGPFMGLNVFTHAILLQPSGKIVVGGNQGTFRLTSGGVRETEGFGTPPSAVYSLLQTPDGSIYAGGNSLSRYTAEGIRDTGFNTGAFNGTVLAIASQNDGKVILGGNFTVYNGAAANRIVRLNTDGSRDFLFNTGGTTGIIYSFAVQPENRLLVGGSFGDFDGLPRLSIVRLIAPTIGGTPRHTPFDYDGDGRSDLSVRRSSDDTWYLQRSAAGYTALTWGVAGDLMAPADYDADGRTDVAVFRPSEGRWYVVMSGSGAFQVFNWGAAGDVPVPADHDGDGRADLVVYRESDSTWYASSTVTGPFRVVQFGAAGDRPQVGDFDGDGRADPAVFRPADNVWYLLRTGGGGFTAQTWGEAGDVPVPADYDGDGKTDIAVYRRSLGRWYVSASTAGFYTVNWGVNTDTPVPADYDGDGRADPAVFRPSEGRWYLNRSTAGLLSLPFGQTGDLPTQGAFTY